MGIFSDIKTYVTYRHNVPFDGTFTTETGPITNPEVGEWSGPNDHDPIEHQH